MIWTSCETPGLTPYYILPQSTQKKTLIKERIQMGQGTPSSKQLDFHYVKHMKGRH